jgi:transposase
MDIHPVCVGIDVSKAWLDVYEEGAPLRCANTSEAIAPLAARWAGSDAFVVFEATGVYAERLRLALQAAGVRFACVNPGRARDFARAAGFLAKTDRVDARMLAAMGRALQPRPAELADPARERLAALTRRRDQLVAVRKQERTRLKGAVDPDIAQGLARHLAWLDAEVKVLERAMAQAANAPSLAAALKLLRTIPGIGPIAAAVLLGLMPELGRRPAKSLAALAGLAPLNRDSGLHRGRRTISGGRKRVRDALYMAAVSVSSSRSRLGERYRALKTAGKPSKLALIATARKLLVTANAVLRDNTAWQP